MPKKPLNPPETFPFLKLPHFPLKYVINQMDFRFVIYLTMKYSRFKRAVESAKFHVDQLHFHIGKFNNSIFVIHQGQELKIEPKCNELGYKSTGMKLNGILTPICWWGTHVIEVFAESYKAKMDFIDKITHHLLRILRVQKFTARCNMKYDFENLFIWKYTKKFGKFEIEPLEKSEIVLSPKELHFLLEEVKIDEPVLNLKVENGYKYPKYPLPGSIVVIQNNNWIDFDKLTIGPNCVFFTMESCPISNACGNRLLKEWIAGKNDKLENMEFRLKDWFEGPNVNEDLLEGITTAVNTFSEKQLDTRGVWRHNMAVPLLDIKRSTDGRLCTISRWIWWVKLYVWHPQHIDELEKESE